MIINIDKFILFLRKATLNYELYTIEIKFTKDRIWAGSIGPTDDYIVSADRHNDIIEDIYDEEERRIYLELKNTKLVKVLTAIENRRYEFNVSKIAIHISYNEDELTIPFCAESLLRSTDIVAPENADYFLEMTLTNDLVRFFKTIWSMGSTFQYIKIEISDSEWFMGVYKHYTDDNQISMRVRFAETEYMNDIFTFARKPISQTMRMIYKDFDEYKLKLLKSKNGTCVLIIERSDRSERYYFAALQVKTGNLGKDREKDAKKVHDRRKKKLENR